MPRVMFSPNVVPKVMPEVMLLPKVGPCGEEAEDQMVSCAHLTLLRGIAEEQSEVGTGNHLVRGFLTTWPL